MYQVFLLNALFAATFVLAKQVLAYTSPIFFAGMCMTIGGSCLLGYMLVYHPKKCVIAVKDAGLFLQVSLFSIMLSYGLQFWGMQYMPAFKSCFLYNFGPFASYLIAYLFFAQKMKLKKWIGLIIGFFGLIPIILSSSPGEAFMPSTVMFSLPELAVIASVVMYSYGWFIVKILVHERQYSPLLVNGVSMFVGGISMLALVPIIEGPIVVTHMMPFVGLLCAVILVELVICNNLYALLLERYSETFLSFTTFSIPIFGAIYSAVFLREDITWHFFLSSAILVAAIWFFYSAEHEEKNI